MPVATYYLHDPAAPKPNSPTRMGTNVLLECRGRLLLEQRWDCGAWGLPGGRLRRGESEVHGIARELFEETGLRLPEAAFTRVRVVDDADRIASYQDGTVWRMVIVLFRAQLPQEPELHCSRESCTLRFFTPEELRTANLVPTHRDLIEAWRPAPLEVAAAMLTRGQTVLLCRRPEGKARALQWEFPGGKLEPGETGEQALARECREELGADGPRRAARGRAGVRLSGSLGHLTLYQAEPLTEPRALEHSALDWVGAASAGLERYDLCPATTDARPGRAAVVFRTGKSPRAASCAEASDRGVNYRTGAVKVLPHAAYG